MGLESFNAYIPPPDETKLLEHEHPLPEDQNKKHPSESRRRF